MAGFVLMSEEEKQLDQLRLSVLIDLLSAEGGDVPFSMVYNIYKQNKKLDSYTNGYYIPKKTKEFQILRLDEIPIAFYDCYLSREQLISRDFDFAEEYAKTYLRVNSKDGQWHDSIGIFDLIDNEFYIESNLYRVELHGNVNVQISEFLNKSKGNLTIRQYIYEICKVLQNNEFYFSSCRKRVNSPILYQDNPFETISVYAVSCATKEINLKAWNKFNGLTLISVKCYFQYYKDVKSPFEDRIEGIWYDKTIPYFNRKTWVESLFLITKLGFYIPVKEILNTNKEDYSDKTELTQPYSLFLCGALKMTFCYAFTENVENTLDYLYKLLSDSKITVVKDEKNSTYEFLYSLPYYNWI